MKWVIRSVAFVAALFVGVVAVAIIWPSVTQDCVVDLGPKEIVTYDMAISSVPTAQDVSVCELKRNPAKYNHTQVMVRGYFSRGFEDSMLADPACVTQQWIWVELGGKRSTGVMYCCGSRPSREREQELVVEGIKLPIREDAEFNRYDKLLNDGKLVEATVVGTFFSGEKRQEVEGGHTYYAGYGHMGIGSLFVVKQVFDVAVTMGQDRHQ
jgi:hypothetical protein